MRPINIEIVHDFICPWCWIGGEHLKQAIAQANLAVAPTIEYIPYELNPRMPREGVDRKLYRSAKFGSWARSQAMDAEVTLAGKRAGLLFDYDKVAITPNTRLAHRLLFYAASKGDAARTQALFDAIFAAYFSVGDDIGSVDVLARLAVSAGFDEQDALVFLATTNGDQEIVAAETQAQLDGVRSVPTLRIDGVPVSGAQPASVLAEILRRAATSAEESLS